jgi:di/tricarboxylate transporter
MKLKLATLLAAVLAFVSSPAMACVGCREPGDFTLNHESPTVHAGAAFSWSVIFMLGFVMAVLAGLSFYIWRTYRELEESRMSR